MPRAAALLLALLAASLALPGAHAGATRSCELLPHGAFAGVGACSVSDVATRSIRAVVSVTVGTVDAIEIEIARQGGERHVFLCTYEVVASTCLFPVQTTSSAAATWTVTARIVAADPLGPALYGGVDTHARLDATFE